MTTLSSPNDGANDDKSIHQQQQKLPRHFPPLGNNIFHYRSCSSAMCFVKLHFCSLGFGKRKYWRFLLRRWGDELWLGCVYKYDLGNAGRGNGKKSPSCRFPLIRKQTRTLCERVRIIKIPSRDGKSVHFLNNVWRQQETSSPTKSTMKNTTVLVAFALALLMVVADGKDYYSKKQKKNT